MFNSIVLDVVIGLLFIYLLYSLLASILSEIAATAMSLRARNLKEAIDRMLNDDNHYKWLLRFLDSMHILKNPKNPVVNAFYDHPEIKYQGSSGTYKNPSNFKASSFSKALIELLADGSPVTKENLEDKLNKKGIKISVKKKKQKNTEEAKMIKKARYKLAVNTIIPKLIQWVWKSDPTMEETADEPLGSETASYIRSLWKESQGDIEKFKILLEGWFEKTMVQTLEWYKRKIRWVTFVIGFLLAWFFYADTFAIVKILSTDKNARDQMVSMTNTFLQNNPSIQDSIKLDSLLAIKKQLQEDISKANSILGFGGWPPDTIFVNIDPAKNTRYYIPPIDEQSIPKSVRDSVVIEYELAKNGEPTKKVKKAGNVYVIKESFSINEKFHYLFRLLKNHFFGFLMTAMAISLGAPFWFDFLNKIMKLRTSSKEEINIPADSASATTTSPLNRVG